MMNPQERGSGNDVNDYQGDLNDDEEKERQRVERNKRKDEEKDRRQKYKLHNKEAEEKDKEKR